MEGDLPRAAAKTLKEMTDWQWCELTAWNMRLKPSATRKGVWPEECSAFKLWHHQVFGKGTCNSHKLGGANALTRPLLHKRRLPSLNCATSPLGGYSDIISTVTAWQL